MFVNVCEPYKNGLTNWDAIFIWEAELGGSTEVLCIIWWCRPQGEWAIIGVIHPIGTRCLSCPAHISEWIFMIHTSYDMFPHNKVRFGVMLIMLPILGAWIGISSLTRKILKLVYCQNCCTESNHIWHIDKDQQILFGWSKHAYIKSKMAAIHCLEKSKRHHLSTRNLAWWCILTIGNISSIKIAVSWKSKMADGCHVERWQKWPYLGNGFTDQHDIC